MKTYKTFKGIWNAYQKGTVTSFHYIGKTGVYKVLEPLK